MDNKKENRKDGYNPPPVKNVVKPKPSPAAPGSKDIMIENTVAEEFLRSSKARLEKLKQTGESAIAQVNDDDLYWLTDDKANSIAIIIQHLHGNMLSRWTDFLTSDGEKAWRDRDREFIQTRSATREALMQKWEEGWNCVFHAMNALTPDDLTKEITIRGDAQSVIHTILRQISHYSYHIGQIVFIARMRKGENWQTLSIARGQSKSYKPNKD